MTYDVGDLVRFEATFKDLEDDLTDPDTVTLKIKDPAGEITELETDDLAHPSTGHYTYDMVIADRGRYFYRFEGTGAVTAAAEGKLYVKRSAFA